MYTVIWLDDALDAFADLYVAADPPGRGRMAAGVEALNRRLADRPSDEGESREGDLRIVFSALLVVRFRVDLIADMVQVESVDRYGR